jgi:hypothetical protein
MKQQARRMRELICEYELVKARKHPHFAFASDFYKARGIKKQNFLKYYHSSDGSDSSVLPAKRGPKSPHTRFLPLIKNLTISLRREGLSRYEIHAWFADRITRAPSPSTIYNIFKRNNLNRLRPQQKRCRKVIIKHKAGELGRFDCYRLPRGFITGMDKMYLVGGIDDATRLAWVELMPDITSLSVMFGSMQILRILQDRYGVRTETIMTDNGSEFKSTSPNKHPFEKLLLMLEIKHIYTKPYRRQPNGKIERFWRTLFEDLLEEAEYPTIESFKNELQKYMLYYNEIRGHSSLGGITPSLFNEKLHKEENSKDNKLHKKENGKGDEI